LLGYRRREVDDAVAARDSALEAIAERLSASEKRIGRRDATIRGHKAELVHAKGRIELLEEVATDLAQRVVHRDRQVRRLRAELARERERSGSLVPTVVPALTPPELEAERLHPIPEAAEGERPPLAPVPAASNGYSAGAIGELFEGLVEVEIGPLNDFAQLVGFEDAADGITATSEI
jgi:hypothetical protein